jgi:predicted O-methyltransferase YrrM
LRATKPRFHGERGDESWRIHWDALRWLFRTATTDSRTLETGCGYSTIAFAAAGATHTVVSPDAGEQSRVRDWCAERDVATDRVEFVVDGSERWLPRSCPDALDLVLIDGNHAFPWPFLDWFYTATRLNVGGLVVVDDTHLRTGAVLCDFLDAEAGRWKRVGSFKQSAVFEKLVDDAVEPGWWNQPWGAGTDCR